MNKLFIIENSWIVYHEIWIKIEIKKSEYKKSWKD